MSEHAQTEPRSWSDRIEETLIAVLLGLMTLITFANVIARYIFNDNILWALETTVFLFAWLVLLGASYGVKKTLHLGVDMLVVRIGPASRKVLGLASVACCLTFSLLMLIGSWQYWYPSASTRTFLIVNDIPMPGFLQFLSDWMNYGEKYDKLPRFIPYFVLPLSMFLLTFRFIQVGVRIARGEAATLVASHEAEGSVNAAQREA
ncbi:MAG: TRAP transporter small permease [Alphaproteobacteria bacterium]|jgi:C4-dicarboxylate transporter DctQ subunit